MGTPRLRYRALKIFKQNPTIWLSAAAMNLRCNPNALQDIKAKKLGFKSYLKQTAPKYIKNQEEPAKSGQKNVHKKNAGWEKSNLYQKVNCPWLSTSKWNQKLLGVMQSEIFIAIQPTKGFERIEKYIILIYNIIYNRISNIFYICQIKNYFKDYFNKYCI